jgi:phytoene dehydrogenase-like protein
MSLPCRAEVVVVGAGPAGLCAACRLAAAGVEVLVLEASETVGCRVATDVTGDHRDTRSVQGTMVSGRRAATPVLRVRQGWAAA